MQKMNDFIVGNQQALRNFFDKLLVPIPNFEEKAVELPKNLKENSLAFIHSHITTNVKKLNSEMDSKSSQETISALRNLLNSMGSPVEPIKL